MIKNNRRIITQGFSVVVNFVMAVKNQGTYEKLNSKEKLLYLTIVLLQFGIIYNVENRDQ